MSLQVLQSTGPQVVCLDPVLDDYCQPTVPSREIRLKWSEHGDLQDAITVRLANDGAQRNSASILLNRMYSWRGYGSNHIIPHTRTHTTFTATARAETIGTITLAVDSKAGLSLDKTFQEELDAFRCIPGTKLCELTKLAFDPSAPSKPLLASMFHLVFIYGQRQFGCTDLFIEVNPRHVRFYQIMLGFELIGSLRTNQSVSAPAQLLRLKISKIREEIDKLAGTGGGSTTRSLYPYFFSPKEEEGIYRRMTT